MSNTDPPVNDVQQVKYSVLSTLEAEATQQKTRSSKERSGEEVTKEYKIN